MDYKIVIKGFTCRSMHYIAWYNGVMVKYSTDFKNCIKYNRESNKKISVDLQYSNSIHRTFFLVLYIVMRVTPPSPLAYCVPLYLGFAYCVPPFFGLAYCVPFNNNNNYFGRFHLHKEVKITVCCMHLYSNSWKHKLWFVCLLNFLDFDLPKSMFKFINAEMTTKKRERSERAIFFRVIWLCMSHVLCFFNENWTFLK